MSAAVATEPHRHATAAKPGKLTFAHLLRGEWIKFWSVRSTAWTMSIFLVAIVGLVLLFTLAVLNAPSPEQGGPPEGTAVSPLDAYIPAVYLGQFALAVLGALTITGEYTTGMIRSSLTAAPKRLGVLWSKAVVLGVVTLVAAAAGVALAAALQALFFGGQDMAVDLSADSAPRALFGTALYLATISLLSFAFGALLRHSAAAVATILGLLLVLPIVFSLVPWKPLQYVLPFLPGAAGQQITMTDAAIEAQAAATAVGADLSAWEGYGVLVAWVVVVLAIAAVLLKRRDA
ncbi:ABC transporter permease subunit [Cellulomonas humilata]|uniref:ABC transporter permease subunit n=1 Tax=Cellulomonas humilata TaxID=144055 RepID=A0A7Y6A1M5_9CELL|nr:ABC transporter permease subunit [Cellulomonas humilata]NUU16834.1 ABC transporter permease subunit [Cellulomonas humilata]